MELAQRYNPIVYLSKDESHFPTSPDYYLQHAMLHLTFEDGKSTTVGNLTQEVVYDEYKKAVGLGTLKEAKLEVYKEPDRVIMGDPTLQSADVHVIQQNFSNKPDYTYLTYVYFYTYNGTYSVCNVYYTGEHFADIEHITVEIDNKTKKAVRFYYGAHGSTDGSWYTPDE